jgi:peptidyl-prolyl cis-trans isomerase C
MKKYVAFLILLLPLLACSKKQETKPLVTIDDDKVSLQQFNAELDKIPMNMKMLMASQAGKREFLDRLIERKLLLREAKKAGVEKDKEFQDQLEAVRDTMIIQSLVKKKIAAVAARMSDEELQKYYDAHKQEFKRDREIRTRQIVVATEQEAKEIQTKIAKGEDFGELAKRFSMDPSAKTSGGDLGFHPKGSLIPEYEEAAFKLTKVGQVTPPVKSKFGYHVIKLEGVREGQIVPFAEVKDFINQKMVQEKQTEVLKNYVQELKKNAKIVVNEELLKSDAGKSELSGPGGSLPTGQDIGKSGETKSDNKKQETVPAKTETGAPAKDDASSKK